MNRKVIIAGEERTLIVARRPPAEPKTVLAGSTLDFCSARFRASMDVVSEERAPSRPSVNWGVVVAIVETRGGCEGLYGTEADRKNPKIVCQ